MENVLGICLRFKPVVFIAAVVLFSRQWRTLHVKGNDIYGYGHGVRSDFTYHRGKG